MKQLIYVPGKVGLASGYNPYDATKLVKDSLAFFKLDGTNASLTTKPTCNFGIMLGRGANNQPLVFPEVDYKSLTVVKTLPQDGEQFSANVTIPDIVIGNTYTIILVKKNVVFHERNTWTATTLAKTDSAADVAEDLANQLKNSSETSGVKVTVEGSTINFVTNDTKGQFTVIAADDLAKDTVVVNEGAPAILDKAFVQDLASRCAAGKGFNYTAEDAHEMYPGYPEVIEDNLHTMYTLRFAVPRVAAKQRDEVVYQIVHIVLDAKSPAISTIDAMFGTGEAAQPSVLSDDGDGDDE